MFKRFNAKTESVAAEGQAPTCPDCGCDLSGHHWNHCPRCYRELPGRSGCGGCGACKH